MTEYETEAAAVAAIARQTPHEVPVEPGTAIEVYTPHGWHTVDGEYLLGQPRRQTGTMTLSTVASFLEALDRYAGAGAPVFFGIGRDLHALAVLNAPHNGTEAGWSDHRILLAPVPPTATERWLKVDRRDLTQEQFANLVEDNLAAIVDPDAATLLEIAQTLSATIGAKFKQGVRLSSGARQFEYSETIETKAGGAGELAVPERLTLQLRLIEGGEPVEIGARLRFRIRDGALTFTVILDDLDPVYDSARQDLIAVVESTLAVAYVGLPWE